MIVKHRLPEIMAKHKIRKISELAIKVQYDYFKLNRFYNEQHKNIDPELIATLCNYFDISIDELLYLDTQK